MTVFVDLQLTGDHLDPDEISAIVPVPPRTAYRKGESYYAGPRTGYLRGRTGVWYVTSEYVESSTLADHVAFLQRFPLPKLRDIIQRRGLRATISVFGGRGPIPATLIEVAEALEATIDA